MSHHRKHKSNRQLRTVAVLPCMVTLLNAVCGFAAIHFTARGMSEPNRLWLVTPELTFFAAAAYMIFLGMIADALDGRLARLSHSSTGFGGQLDSMCDMVTFGVAPAFLMLRVVENALAIGPASPAFGNLLGRSVWLVAVAYMCCTGLRLARFNVENRPDEKHHRAFKGLPSPAAAGVVASLVLLYGDLVPEFKSGAASDIAHAVGQGIAVALPLVALAVAVLMVSQVPYPHVINQYVIGRKPFGYVVRSVLLVLLLIWKLQLTLAITFLAFAGQGLVHWLKIRREKLSDATDDLCQERCDFASRQ